MKRRVSVGQLGRATARNEQMDGLRQTLAAQVTGQLVANQGSHAMTEESEGLIANVRDDFGEGFDQRVELAARWLFESNRAPRQLNRADIHGWRKPRLPVAKGEG